MPPPGPLRCFNEVLSVVTWRLYSLPPLGIKSDLAEGSTWAHMSHHAHGPAGGKLHKCFNSAKGASLFFLVHLPHPSWFLSLFNKTPTFFFFFLNTNILKEEENSLCSLHINSATARFPACSWEVTKMLCTGELTKIGILCLKLTWDWIFFFFPFSKT